MSDEHWEITAAPTAAEAHEAMFLAGKSIVTGRKRFVQIAHAIFVGLFAPLGATMVLWIGVQLSGGPDLGSLPVGAVPVTLLVFAGLSLWLMMRIYFLIAQATVESRFGRQQQVTIDAEGITQVTAHSRWHSGWGDVSAVRGGKTTLTVSISGIAIPLPRRAFPDPPEAERALAAMQRWQEAAQ